jgi:hypothetical protein
MPGGPFGIVELLERVGEGSLGVQFLSECMLGIDTNRQGQSTIRFGTDAVTANEVMKPGPDTRVGIVVWVPRHRLEAARLAHEKNEPMPGKEVANTPVG